MNSRGPCHERCFQAIYAKLYAQQGPSDAYTLLGGRIFRSRAPKQHSNSFPIWSSRMSAAH